MTNNPVYSVPLKLVTENGSEIVTITVPVKLRATSVEGRGVTVTLEGKETLMSRFERALQAFADAFDHEG